MIPFPSKLEVYCINLTKNPDKKGKTKKKVAIEVHNPIKDRKFPLELVQKKVKVKPTFFEEKYGQGFALALKDAEGLAKNEQLHIIDTKQELAKYENANNNRWVIYNDKVKKIQFYIKHPKSGKDNILIEAENFYKFVENEYDLELKNYCMSHCDLKNFIITKVEEKEYNAKANIIEGKGKFAMISKKGNIFHMKSPEPLRRIEPLPKYNWLEKDFMQCVNALSKGAKFENAYECDLTIGIEANYAKAVSLNVKAHKKYRYVISIEC